MTRRSRSYFARTSSTPHIVQEQPLPHARYFHEPTDNFDRAPYRGSTLGCPSGGSAFGRALARACGHIANDERR